MSTVAERDWSTIDNSILDPAWYTTPEHQQAFRALRDEDPIHWTRDGRFGKDYWLLTRYEHVRDLLLANNEFSSRLGTRVPRSPRRDTPEERFALHQVVQVSHLDEPLHGVYRRPINKHFSAPAVGRLKGEINQFVDELLEELAPRGEFELIEELSAELPVRVILRMLGVPESDWPHLRLASWQFLAAADPRFTIDGDPVATSKHGRQQLIAYCSELALERRRHPRDDFATLVGQMEIDGDRLSVYEMATWFVSIVSGGLATTRNAVGVGTWLFTEHPDQRQLLLDDPSRAKGMVEEVLRWSTPARNRLRVVNEDIEFHGQRFRAGDWVVGLLSSANWDERVFSDPERFDIERDPNPHLALGAGVHMCLGRALVRLELAALFPKLLRAFPDLHTEEKSPRWLPDASASGFSAMKMAFTPTEYKPTSA